MVTIVKHEWHQHDRQYAIELGEDLLSEIYPDMDEDEIASLLKQLENNEADIDEIISDAYDNDVEIEWDFQYDDCWTDRKGGYEVTYEYGDESSWVEPDKEPEPTHKCTKCKWVGQSYDAEWLWPEDDETGEQEAKKVCPMCDSDTELTEVGIKEEQEKQERQARWAKQDGEDEDEDDAERTQELEDALEELKREFDELLVAEDEDEKTNTSSTHWPTPNSNFVETAKWPFEKTQKETNEVPVAWPFERPEEGPRQKLTMEQVDKMEEEVLPNYPAGEYTIRVWGRTREIGVSKIKKAQYNYWSDEDHEDDLSDALNENYDYDENKTPKAARFDLPYYEYQDKISFWGFDEGDTHVTITNSDGVEIYEGDMGWFEGEEVEELYPEYLGKGYWLMWTQGGKGSCLQVTIDTGDEEFDPNEITFTTWDVQGSSVINRVQYQGVDLEDEGMDSEHDNWRGQWSEFNVYENE